MKAVTIQTEEELKQAFYIRKKVFIEEQGTPEKDEYDQFDSLKAAEHILILDKNNAVGTARWRVVDGIGKLERICILKSYRKLGIGNMIVSKLEELAAKKGLDWVKLHGQVQAERFYQKLGYQTDSDVFMEDGIPHVLMWKKLPETKSSHHS
ncbi:GNAT family N-acetyltransferase [Guptibacillus hwajinpoensis]|uniref:GNAT family N-acyltransferase n=1 Tax=Guptibacillus hwajinpoensis TaxID=208199 RepID=A0ABU0K361_9BACL|nr:GNAT family N-acetyltransferase [Alkalihalobacillus hemicentroti]MDQ0483802.1 putative GNAT family N-acyltransferase [Alkalihalobacillus hemicentroti]